MSAVVISQVFYSIFTFLGEVPTGIFADTVGQKHAVVIGHLLNAFSFAIMLLMPSTIGLFVGYSLLGLADSFISGSAEAILYESSPKNSFKKHLGAYFANEIFGFAVSAAIAGVLLGKYHGQSYTPILLMTIVAKILAFLVALSLVNPSADIRIPDKGKQAFSVLKRSFHIIKHNNTVWTLTLVVLLTLSGEYFLYSVYQPYFETHAVAPIFIGFVFSAGAIINFFVLRYAYLLERWLTLEKIILFLNGPLALLYIAFALWVHPLFLVASFVCMKGIFNAQLPILQDYIHEQTTSDIRATVTSGISLIKSLVQIGTRILLGVLVGAFGIQKTLLIQGTYLMIGALIAYWLLIRCGCTHKIKQHYQ